MDSALQSGETDAGPAEPEESTATEPAESEAEPEPEPESEPESGPEPEPEPEPVPRNPAPRRPRKNTSRWRRRRKKILIWGSASLAVLLVAVGASGYTLMRHFNANIQQDDISGLLGAQPVNLHPQAENIMVLGSDSRLGLSQAFGSGLVTDQSDTLMIIHIPANRQWAEVMSIPRDSWVNIPSCKMGDGQMSAPTQFKINEAFAIGNLDGNHTSLGVACTVKTIEQDTGIYINHFIVVNFTGLEEMVGALGGVYECNSTPINDPDSGLHLAAGTHLLTPAQALGYVRARYSLGDGSDLERIGRQQAFMSSLIARVKSELLDPLAIYRFLDAATKSLTIDSQLGGITGLYDLGQSLRGIPSSKIAFFTVPNFPRGEVVPSDTANVLWTQPEDNQIFATFRNDVPASPTLFDQPGGAAATATASPPSVAAGGLPEGSASLSGPSTTPTAAPSVASSPTATASPVTIQARTANQSICSG
jgi:LCP family protein required for cell wall assembly